MFVDPTAVVHATAKLGPLVAVLANVRIGAGAVIGAGSIVGESVVVGEKTVLGGGVRLSNCAVGAHCLLHQGVSVGQDGFGFHLDEINGLHSKKPQELGVIIEDNVEIGANSTIDRGSWRDTIIGNGSKTDNLVQIGHNVQMGKGCIIGAQTGIGGSTTLGNVVIVGAQCGLLQHITLVDGVKVAARSGVFKSVLEKCFVGGYPAVPIREFHRATLAIRNLSRRR